jgi:hypothetical protein
VGRGKLPVPTSAPQSVPDRVLGRESQVRWPEPKRFDLGAVPAWGERYARGALADGVVTVRLGPIGVGLTDPLHEEQVHRVLVLVDEVDELSGLVWPEVPAANRAVRVVLVLRLAVPRCQSEHVDELGVGGENLRWQRRELLEHSLVGDDVVHDLAA